MLRTYKTIKYVQWKKEINLGSLCISDYPVILKNGTIGIFKSYRLGDPLIDKNIYRLICGRNQENIYSFFGDRRSFILRLPFIGYFEFNKLKLERGLFNDNRP